MMKNTMAMIGAMMSQGRYLPFLKWNLSMNTPAKRADTVSTADALAAMTPEMASGSCATSVRKNRKKAVSRVAAIEKPISDTPPDGTYSSVDSWHSFSSLDWALSPYAPVFSCVCQPPLQTG